MATKILISLEIKKAPLGALAHIMMVKLFYDALQQNQATLNLKPS